MDIEHSLPAPRSTLPVCRPAHLPACLYHGACAPLIPLPCCCCSREQVSALLSALRSSFSVFSSTYLALTGGLIQWELDLDEDRDVLWGSTLQARRAKRERTGPTNPDRMIAQPGESRGGGMEADGGGRG